MIKVYYNRLENDKIEMTREMLTDILSYMKTQEKEIEKLKSYRDFIYNVIITPENWNSNEIGYELHSHTKQELYKKLYDLREEIIKGKYNE